MKRINAGILRSVLLLQVILLPACVVKPLSSVDRTKIHTVAINPRIESPAKYAYADVTGNRSRSIGAQFGVIGILVGGAVGAGSESTGRQHFDRVAAASPVNAPGVVRRAFTSTLETSKMFQIVPPANADATFNIEILSYGVAPINAHELGAQIIARATLVDRTGKSVWKKQETASSNVTAMLDGYEKNPRLWAQAMDEAAEKLSRQFILYTSDERR